MSSYQDRVCCDILDIDVAHIMLGRPWLYDLDVISIDRSNTHEFKFNEKDSVETCQAQVSTGEQGGNYHKQWTQEAASFSD